MVNNSLAKPLSRHAVIATDHDVFMGSVEALPEEVHFELDPAVPQVQCAPHNVPVAMKGAVKTQLDKYEGEGHITQYLVEVDNTLYCCNRVDPRVAEPLPAQHPMASAEGFASNSDGVQAQEDLSEAEVTRSPSPQPRLSPPQITHTATVPTLISNTPFPCGCYGWQL